MVLLITNIQIFASQYVYWVVWIIYGLLWCFYQLFELSFWRHPFTAEDPLVKNELIYILDGLTVSTFSAKFCFWVNLSFSFHSVHLFSKWMHNEELRQMLRFPLTNHHRHISLFLIQGVCMILDLDVNGNYPLLYFCFFFLSLKAPVPIVYAWKRKCVKNIRIFIFGELSQKWDGDKRY